MNIIVFDVPAEHGGALSVLYDFYHEVTEYDDKSINWIFVLSTPNLEETENIKVLRYPWVKSSWFHRIYFDFFVAPKIVKKYNATKLFSLQNVLIPRVKCDQVLYVHQSLPFIDYKFSFNENRLFWFYQNIVGRSIISSIRKAKKVIVQTEWMKEACVKKLKTKLNKIEVIPPTLNIVVKEYFRPCEKNLKTFFYPANASYYKNHKIIVEACKKLSSYGINDYKIIFTLEGKENSQIEFLFEEVQKNNLPIHFIGKISREEVFSYYSKSVLIFPSYIETFGLPLLEAKLHKTMIIAADTLFSHEILDGYENVYYFNPFDSNSLFKLLKKVLEGKVMYKEVRILKKIDNKKNIINCLINQN